MKNKKSNTITDKILVIVLLITFTYLGSIYISIYNKETQIYNKCTYKIK